MTANWWKAKESNPYRFQQLRVQTGLPATERHLPETKKPSATAGLLVMFAEGEIVTMGRIMPEPDICRQAAIFISFIAKETGANASLSRSLQALKQAKMNPSHSLLHCSEESSRPSTY